jgi:hypothetical protein
VIPVLSILAAFGKNGQVVVNVRVERTIEVLASGIAEMEFHRFLGFLADCECQFIEGSFVSNVVTFGKFPAVE